MRLVKKHPGFTSLDQLSQLSLDDTLLPPLWPDGEGVEALYPAVDITPAALLTGIIT